VKEWLVVELYGEWSIFIREGGEFINQFLKMNFSV